MNLPTMRLVLISLLLAFPVSEALAQQGNYRLGQVLGLRYFTLTNGDPEAYVQRVQEVTYPFHDRHVPGVDWILLQGDRGKQNGSLPTSTPGVRHLPPSREVYRAGRTPIERRQPLRPRKSHDYRKV